ncbi:MAG: hypothetical protein ACOCX0_05855 [Bacteroidota bacterium]
MEILGLPYKRFIFYIVFALVLNLINFFFYYVSMVSGKKTNFAAKKAEPAKSANESFWDKLRIEDHRWQTAEGFSVIVTFTCLSFILDAWVKSVFAEHLYYYIFIPFGILLLITVYLAVNKVVKPLLMRCLPKNADG